MKFTEVQKDLFTVDESYHLAHCIASDLAMGAGIAVPMNAKFRLRSLIVGTGESLKPPTCVLTGRVFNMITKEKSWMKPLVADFLSSLWIMRDLAVQKNIKKIAMPRIGCGLDGLQWVPTSNAIKKAFDKTDIEILVCVWK